MGDTRSSYGRSLEERSNHALRDHLLWRRGPGALAGQAGRRRAHGEARAGAREARAREEARPALPAHDHRHGEDRARRRAAGVRRALRRDQGAAAGAVSRGLQVLRRSRRDGAGARGRAAPCERRRGTRGAATPPLPPGNGLVIDEARLRAALAAARPQAMGALLRYFRDLDAAEEAFQEACLRALQRWPQEGPPRNPAAWLIQVGRNAELDQVRRRARNRELPSEELLSDLEDAEAALAESLDASHYRDDVLRLLFICCPPDLPAAQQIALALRVVSGLSVKEIARAFLVSESAMEQRITRAKRRVAAGDVPFETPGANERDARLSAVSAM